MSLCRKYNAARRVIVSSTNITNLTKENLSCFLCSSWTSNRFFSTLRLRRMFFCYYVFLLKKIIVILLICLIPVLMLMCL